MVLRSSRAYHLLVEEHGEEIVELWMDRNAAGALHDQGVPDMAFAACYLEGVKAFNVEAGTVADSIALPS